MSECSGSDSEPGEDTLAEKEMKKLLPEKQFKNLRRGGLVDDRASTISSTHGQKLITHPSPLKKLSSLHVDTPRQQPATNLAPIKKKQPSVPPAVAPMSPISLKAESSLAL